MTHRERPNRDAGAAADLNDRREFARHDYGQVVQAIWMEAFQVQRQIHQYRALDLSRGGLRLVGKCMLYHGTVGAVLLKRDDGRAKLYGIRVRNSRYAGGLLYATGCEFVPLDERFVRATRIIGEKMELSPHLEDFV